LALALALALAPAVAAAQPAPAKCDSLDVTDYALERVPNGHTLIVHGTVHNNTPYRLVTATFFFNFYVGESEKVGQASQFVTNLFAGDTATVTMWTNLKQIDNIAVWNKTCVFAP
jgi:hypothetical protein